MLCISHFKPHIHMQPHRPRTGQIIEITVHVLTWSYIFLSPLLFRHNDEPLNWMKFLQGSTFPFYTCVAFYVNYLLFVPHFVFKKGRLRWFTALNIALCIVLQISLELQFQLFAGDAPAPKDPMYVYFPPKIFFVIRGFLTFVFVIGVSVALRLSMRWQQSEQARAEAELRQSQAELKNLKNQINPHFLLNTLNNIYALTAFDTDKAQHAIHELSRMLRYMLYENQTDRVPLVKEAEFIRSYVELMRLRLAQDVDVRMENSISSNDLQVAPLIFISLVENAFKHGVSPTQKSYIHIRIEADEQHISFACVNSNFPKSSSDKQPGGIGLRQVERRLALSYPGHHRWTSGLSEDGSEFYSKIFIDKV